MRAFVVLYIFLFTHLSQAASSSPSASHSKRSHSLLSRELSSRAPAPFVASAWYSSWHSNDFPLSAVSWSKYTSLTYALATTTKDVHTIGLTASDKQLLPQFVQACKKNGVRAILSIGGWGGSRYFSTAVATAANRDAFAKAVMGVVSQYQLDGIEFDWEYPGLQGIGCNKVSKTDTANFLLFLQTLRLQTGAKNLIISAAVTPKPFAGPDGNPVSDVSVFAEALNYITIMNYENWGPWSPLVGPNSALDDSCAPSQLQRGSAKSAVKAWTAAGMPAKQIVLGVAAYGHSYFVTQSNAYNASHQIHPYVPFDKSKQPTGDKWDSTPVGVDACGHKNVRGGLFDFWGLIDAGFLNADGTAASGINYDFDTCSQTPFVYNPKTEVMVSYDDAHSFAAKGEYIKTAGLLGFGMWEAGGDSHDILLDSIRSALDNVISVRVD
ncbi:chitinase [Russula earlei]|uniref:Chitinase n=1 Tax=Russula earlei TaxID=71964 RepID=A0ACC0TXK8_9AGAM|nr:chitinase [Russula earlei]